MSTNNMHQEIRDAVTKMCLKFNNKYWQIVMKKIFIRVNLLRKTPFWFLSLIPEKYGGAGLPLSAGAVILEEIIWWNAACHAQMYTMGTILRHGSEKQNHTFFQIFW